MKSVKKMSMLSSSSTNIVGHTHNTQQHSKQGPAADGALGDMSRRAAGAGGGSAGAGAGSAMMAAVNSNSSSSSSSALVRASIPFDQLVSLQKRSWQLLCSLDELQAELMLGGEGIVMQWPQLLSRLSGLLSNLVFLSSSLTSPQTTFYSSQLNALETALRREAHTSNLFSPQSADQPNEARDAIRAKPYQLPANVGKLRFSDLAVQSSKRGGQPGDHRRNKLPFLVIHPFEPLPGMATTAAAPSRENGPGVAGQGKAAALNEEPVATGAVEDPTVVGQHLNYLYNLLRTRPDDTVSAEDTAFLHAALPVLLPELGDVSASEIPTEFSREQNDRLRALKKKHDRAALRSLRTWFHLAAATDENGVRYDWKTRVGQEDLDALLASDEGASGADAAGVAEVEMEPVMEEDLEEGEEGEDSDADMEEVG